MRLIIAEKPSLGRAIAQACDDDFSSREGCLVGRKTTVSWCYGHLLEQAPPDAYDPLYKRWSLEHLPIIPHQWKLVPTTQGKRQLGILKKLLKQASEVVHAGDPDREGQLLVQETLDYLDWRGPVLRLLINDLNQTAVSKALRALRDNRDFAPLFQAAECRSRADWLYGINLSRAWTLTGQQAGHQGVLSVGRVQTPVLGLIARRDEERENFVPVPFFSPWADFETAQGVTRAWWRPMDKEALMAQQKMDEDGRLLDPAIAESITQKVSSAPALLKSLTRKRKRQPPPLPYSLSTLQIDAARRYKLSAQHVLDAAQSLYERHKLITYPRSDCRYLPTTYLSGIASTLQHSCAGDNTLMGWLNNADTRLRSSAFDDGKIGAHHGLAPTGHTPQWTRLNANEKHVYHLIVRNVVAQFYPPFEYDDIRAVFHAPSNTDTPEQFIATGRVIHHAGWRPLFTTKNDGTELPLLVEGEAARVINQGIEESMTKAPAPFNDASLLNAMTHVARYVTDASVRKTLRETDGLGTEATRAGIIETLLNRQLIVRQQGTLRATRAGRALISALPDDVTRPERTAQWEQALSLISEGRQQSSPFIDKLISELAGLLGKADVTRMRQAFDVSRQLDVPEGKTSSSAGKRSSRGKYRQNSSRRKMAGNKAKSTTRGRQSGTGK
ncbi:DNA topoisomerase 3 [Halomonadaceae bacterium LMG 33818]|uniref:DNA topoisomerase III n=1 Tax=Cernens ardua TaxID=3402176 RepID=UPI003EDC32FB